jgi:hypothetical protein
METTGLEQVIGLNENLQPKLNALSLRKEAVTMGLQIRHEKININARCFVPHQFPCR